jgi:hypothetical protein
MALYSISARTAGSTHVAFGFFTGRFLSSVRKALKRSAQ